MDLSLTKKEDEEEYEELFTSQSSQSYGIKDLSKNKIILNDVTFNRTQQDRYKCEICGETMNFVLIPAHTKSHNFIKKPKLSNNENKPNLPIPNYVEILELENPNEEVSYQNNKNLKKAKKSLPKKQIKKANNSSAKDVSAKGLPVKDSSAKDLSAKGLPAKDLSENEEGEYYSDEFSGTASGSEELPKPPSSDSSSPEEKQEEAEEKNTDNFKINFESSNEDSLTSSSGDSTMNHHTIESLQRQKGVRGYKCDCEAEFYTYKKYKIHTNIKRASCPRCGEILYCRYLMKNHHIECLKKHFKFRRNEKDKIPNPRYLRGIEEAIRKSHALYEQDYKPEDENWEEYADFVMPSRPKKKFD